MRPVSPSRDTKRGDVVSKAILISDLHAALRLPHARVNADATRSDRLDDVCSLLINDLHDLAIEHDIDDVFVLGDLFHHRSPDAPTLCQISHALKYLVAHEIRVWLLPGNHDAHGKRASLYSLSFLAELQVGGIHVLDKADRRAFPPTGRAFCAMPWQPEKLAAHTVGGFDADSIVFMHQEIKGATDNGRPMTRGLDQHELKRFACVVSGHVHTPQRLKTCRGAYLGSPLELRFSEDDGNERGPWIFDFDRYELTHRPISTTPKFVRWNLSAVSGFDLVEHVNELIDDLVDELGELLDERDVYLDTVLTGTRAEIAKADPLVRAAIGDASTGTKHTIRRLKFATVLTDAGGDRVRELTSGKVSTTEELVEAYVEVFADDDRRERLAKMGRGLLQGAGK